MGFFFSNFIFLTVLFFFSSRTKLLIPYVCSVQYTRSFLHKSMESLTVISVRYGSLLSSSLSPSRLLSAGSQLVFKYKSSLMVNSLAIKDGYRRDKNLMERVQELLLCIELTYESWRNGGCGALLFFALFGNYDFMGSDFKCF